MNLTTIRRSHARAAAALAGTVTVVATLAGCASATDDVATSGLGSEDTAAAAAVASGAPRVVRREPLFPRPRRIWGLARVNGTLVAGTAGGAVSIGEDGHVRHLGQRRDRLTALTGNGSTLWASGRPAAGTDEPDPLGLLRSTDGGRTWSPVSLAGAQQFVVLAAHGDNHLIGSTISHQAFRSGDAGRRWGPVTMAMPSSLALPGDGAVLAANGRTLDRLDSPLATWTTIAGAPHPWLVAADEPSPWMVDVKGVVWRRTAAHDWDQGPAVGQARGLVAMNGSAWVVTTTEVIRLA